MTIQQKVNHLLMLWPSFEVAKFLLEEKYFCLKQRKNVTQCYTRCKASVLVLNT